MPNLALVETITDYSVVTFRMTGTQLGQTLPEYQVQRFCPSAWKEDKMLSVCLSICLYSLLCSSPPPQPISQYGILFLPV
jgi:hypothetical protein